MNISLICSLPGRWTKA